MSKILILEWFERYLLIKCSRSCFAKELKLRLRTRATTGVRCRIRMLHCTLEIARWNGPFLFDLWTRHLESVFAAFPEWACPCIGCNCSCVRENAWWNEYGLTKWMNGATEWLNGCLQKGSRVLQVGVSYQESFDVVQNRSSGILTAFRRH